MLGNFRRRRRWGGAGMIQEADAVVADAWRALEERPGSVATPWALGALDRWVRENGGRLADPRVVRLITTLHELFCEP